MGTPTQYMPPAPSEQKKRVWPKILLGVVVLWVIGTALQDVADQGTTTTAPRDYVADVSLEPDTQIELLRLVWDTEITASDRADICDYYNTPPVGTTPEMVRIFADSAAVPYDEADRLLTVLLAEEC